ncbi:hypothetical protein C4K22_0893 [Pseudomonas chlororaphis subsp. aurantiaca]|nr:hypothetical protein C4K22_0893 [Pseudomonas chlororaphis subsp. aurantiaca]AZD39985.1 hypothetical protein C4K21_0892 [Pseudomonas chlororaphis subsp. aurantiaca]
MTTCLPGRCATQGGNRRLMDNFHCACVACARSLDSLGINLQTFQERSFQYSESHAR